KEAEAISPAVLDRIHGRVGLLDERFHRRAILRKEADANARRDLQFETIDEIGLTEAFDDVLGNRAGVLLVVDGEKEGDKLVATEAPDQIFAAHAAGKPPGNL